MKFVHGVSLKTTMHLEVTPPNARSTTDLKPSGYPEIEISSSIPSVHRAGGGGASITRIMSRLCVAGSIVTALNLALLLVPRGGKSDIGHSPQQRQNGLEARLRQRLEQQNEPAATQPEQRPSSLEARLRQRLQQPNEPEPATQLNDPSASLAEIELRDRDDLARAGHQLLDVGLVLDAAQEWKKHAPTRVSASHNGSCSAQLHAHGLCDASLLRLPRAPRTVPQKPFVFVHLSKCGGTSLLSSLGPTSSFSLRLPTDVTVTPSEHGSTCGSHVSRKCCWCRETLHNLSSSGGAVPRVLTQEPANDEQSLQPPPTTAGGRSDGEWTVQTIVDPGFDGSRDFCPTEDIAGYVTVLRHPVARVHSHMCEIGVGFKLWQEAGNRGPGHVKTQLRDNYYVRALGGAAAWHAPEGGLRTEHLLAAARTLTRFEVVMTVETLETDAAVQMARVGLPGFRLPHAFSRSRAENLERAKKQPTLQENTGSDLAACEVPPNALQLGRLLAGVGWDVLLWEFALLLASRRTEAYRTASPAHRRTHRHRKV